MKQLLILLLTGLLVTACNMTEGSDGDKKCENRIYSHRMYLNSPPWTDLEKVPRACSIPQTLHELAQVEFALRFEFEKCEANTYGFWLQARSDVAFVETEPQFYELSDASVGITLFWFLYEDTEVDVWLEMEDGSYSEIYTFLIEVEGEPCTTEHEICRPVIEEEE